MAAKSKLDMLDNYVLLDLETTGHYPGIDEIIEIGAIRVHNNQPTESYQTFVKCDYLPSEIVELTGITLDDLQNAPDHVDALERLEEFICDSPIIGHNLSFDLAFLKYYGSSITSDTFHWVDTLRLSRKMIPSDRGHGLGAMCSLLEIERARGHRSLDDCLSTHSLYQLLKSKANNEGKTFEDYFKRSHRFSKRIDFSVLQPESDEFDESHPLFGKVCRS